MTIKRLAASKLLPITRKSGGRFITEPKPGPHSRNQSVPLALLIKESLNMADSTKEAKTISKAGKVSVDGRVRKDHKFPVGIFDTITVVDDNYRLIPTLNGFEALPIDKKEASTKLIKIMNKTVVRKGKIQLNLNDGTNMLIDKNDYRTGDSLLVTVPEMKIEKHIPKKEGVQCMITRGKNRSLIGTLEEIEFVRGSGSNVAKINIDGTSIRVPEDIIFVVGSKSPEVTVIK